MINEDPVRDMLRALRPGGGIAITVPQHPWLWSPQDKTACHVRRYRVGEMRKKVLRAGFKVEFETSFVSLLLPAMIASRMAKRKERAGSVQRTMSELSLPTLISRIFEGVMNVERQIIRLGIRFPVGGSLLLIAKKSEAAG